MSCVRLLTLLALVGTARASAVDNQACATPSTPSGTDFFPAAARLSPGNLNSGSASAFVDGGEGFNVTYAETFKVVRAKGFSGGDASLILENNVRMRGALEKMGGTIQKTYRNYAIAVASPPAGSAPPAR